MKKKTKPNKRRNWMRIQPDFLKLREGGEKTFPCSMRIFYPSGHRFELEVNDMVIYKGNPSVTLPDESIVVLDPRAFITTENQSQIYNPISNPDLPRWALDWINTNTSWLAGRRIWEGPTTTWNEMKEKSREAP